MAAGAGVRRPRRRRSAGCSCCLSDAGRKHGETGDPTTPRPTKGMLMDPMDNGEAIPVLLAHGADPRLKDKKVSLTPAGWADHGGHPEIKEILERAEKGE